MPVATRPFRRRIASRAATLAAPFLVAFLLAALAGAGSPTLVAASVDPLSDPTPQAFAPLASSMPEAVSMGAAASGAAGPGAAALAHVRPKAVFVVGATGPATARYRSIAHRIAVRARGYGASVTEIYSPNATWDRVRQASAGANLFVYLGHGNGWPSQYAPFRRSTKDGLGLNRSASGSDYNTRYYGESYLEAGLRLAPDSVVLLVHLCYSAGNSGGPSLRLASERVDNYGAGFLRTGARVVVAEALGKAAYLLNGLFHSDASLQQLFMSAKQAERKFRVEFNAHRSPSWAHGLLDPRRPGQFYRSMIGDLEMSASSWRSASTAR
jgi:hypothetical protein